MGIWASDLGAKNTGRGLLKNRFKFASSHQVRWASSQQQQPMEIRAARLKGKQIPSYYHHPPEPGTESQQRGAALLPAWLRVVAVRVGIELKIGPGPAPFFLTGRSTGEVMTVLDVPNGGA